MNREKIEKEFKKQVNIRLNNNNLLIHKDFYKKIISLDETDEEKEMLIIFAQLFTKALYVDHNDETNETEMEYTVSLYSQLLINTYTRDYKKYLNKLTKLGLINLKYSYSTNLNKSNVYEITEEYRPRSRKNAIKTYKLKTDKVKSIYRKIKLHYISHIEDNITAKIHYIAFAEHNQKTREELIEYAKNLQNNKIKVKGKGFIFNRKRSEKHNRDAYYVEDDIERYLFYTNPDNIFLAINYENRIYTSFNMNSKWIKEAIYGEALDYKCLHPNIAQTVYNGNIKWITHDEVTEHIYGEVTTENRNKVKKQHLSYFNDKKYKQKHYTINEYYEDKSPEMIYYMNLKKEQDGENITHKDMFNIEGEMMNKIAEICLEFDILIEPDFDGLYILNEEDRDIVEAIMNYTVLDMDVYTTVSTVETKEHWANIIKEYKINQQESNSWLEEVIEITKITNTVEETDYILYFDEEIDNEEIKGDINYFDDNYFNNDIKPKIESPDNEMTDIKDKFMQEYNRIRKEQQKMYNLNYI